ncbi:hypothetical protein HMPREF9389_0630 [Streptococcus sanguinis SK355]|uniref:Uncharacterized protein n=1 Tax=Streptococcus sanguinis SK355 TaxID=888816 RepID=F3UP72_STRSA|nr:hypothetical protein HMPREF9389_0630 [Streptococcus sanguinis SK355]
MALFFTKTERLICLCFSSFKQELDLVIDMDLLALLVLLLLQNSK